MNNKGFAITTILYGILILFILLFVSLLALLSQYKYNLEILIENTSGTRDIITMKKDTLDINIGETAPGRGYYNIKNGQTTLCYKYLIKEEEASCE